MINKPKTAQYELGMHGLQPHTLAKILLLKLKQIWAEVIRFGQNQILALPINIQSPTAKDTFRNQLQCN